MSIQEFVNYALAKLGNSNNSSDIVNRILGLVNYNPVLAKEAVDLMFPSKETKIFDKDSPEWLFKYKGKEVTLNHGLVIIDGVISDIQYNPDSDLKSVIEKVLKKIDDANLEMSLSEIRDSLSLAPISTRKAFNNILWYLHGINYVN